MKTTASKRLFAAAQRVIPGGVNSPVRAFRSVGGHPLFIKRAKGALLYDVDGNSFIDYVLSWGPMILGHAPAPVIRAVTRAAANGTSYGAPTELEVRLAQMIAEAVPSMEQVRLVNSGTEAIMSAIRVARAHTKRDGILKFEGCYHGHADYLLAKAGSGVATLGIPGSAGVPEEIAALTHPLPYNDLAELEAAFDAHPDEIAAVILEPVVGNAGCIAPSPGFLSGIRELTRREGALMIVDWIALSIAAPSRESELPKVSDA